MSAAKESNYSLRNLDCANCAQEIEDRVLTIPGVETASVSFGLSTLTVASAQNAKTNRTMFENLQRVIHEVDPAVDLVPAGMSVDEAENSRRRMVWTWLRIGISIGLFLVGLIFQESLRAFAFWAEIVVMLPAYLLSGYPVLLAAGRNFRRGRIFDENFLMTLATTGAWVIGEIPEAVGVMIFYMIGETLQELSVRRSRQSIRALLAVRPDSANRVTEAGIETVPVEQVKPGDQILVRPGERVPLDGVVISGKSNVDTSAMTGEFVPSKFAEGDEILAGMVNQTEMLRVEVTRYPDDTAISRILKLVESAASRKAPTERFISRFARFYTPVVVGIAAGIAFLPPLLVPGQNLYEWVYRALVVLVISCPCALVISIPLGYFGGVGAASRRGILVKGSNFLDVLARVKTVVFDKTGTLTHGVFRVVDVRPVPGKEKTEVMDLAAEAEAHSTHPIALSIREASGRADVALVDGFEEISGHGVRVHNQGRDILAGNDGLMHRENIPHPTCDIPGTVVHIAENGQYVGYLVVDDEVKSDVNDAIAELRELGVNQLFILSGDRSEKVAQLAADLSMDGYQAGLLPEEKVDALELLLTKTPPEARVAYVGDGINDAPVITRADVGIAMGALGSQAAIENADVVVMSDSPRKVAEAIQIGKRTRRIVWQNIILALGIKALFIGLGITGEASMWEAVFADMGVALLAILNAVRIFR